MISAPPRESQSLLICQRKEFYAAPVQRAEHHINSCRGTPSTLTQKQPASGYTEGPRAPRLLARPAPEGSRWGPSATACVPPAPRPPRPLPWPVPRLTPGRRRREQHQRRQQGSSGAGERGHLPPERPRAPRRRRCHPPRALLLTRCDLEGKRRGKRPGAQRDAPGSARRVGERGGVPGQKAFDRSFPLMGEVLFTPSFSRFLISLAPRKHLRTRVREQKLSMLQRLDGFYVRDGPAIADGPGVLGAPLRTPRVAFPLAKNPRGKVRE